MGSVNDDNAVATPSTAPGHEARAFGARFSRPLLGLALIGAASAGGFAMSSLLAPGAASAVTAATAASVRLQANTNTTTPATSGSTGAGTYCTPGAGPRGPVGLRVAPATSGTVLSVDSSAGTFDVLTTKGVDVTVQVSSSTRYLDRAVSSPGLSDVTAGKVVAVGGTTSSSGTVTASSVVVLPGRNALPGTGSGWPGSAAGRTGTATAPVASGAVLSVDPAGNSFTVLTTSGTTETVNVSSSTTYRELGTTSVSLSDLSRGERVSVQGTESSGTVTATEVCIQPAVLGGPGYGHGPGGPGGPGVGHGPGGMRGQGGPGNWAPPSASSSSGSTSPTASSTAA